jgi:hypothetical protein
MAFFDTFTNPMDNPTNTLATQVNPNSGGFFDGINIFGARQPEVLAGILTQDQQDKLRKQSLLQGLLGAGATYLATPKNLGAGSALPYIGKAFLGGMQSSQGVYNTALENEMNKLKIAKELRDAELDRLKAIPNDIRQFEYGVQNPAYFAREEKLRTLSRPTNIINNAPAKAILDVDKGTIEGLVASTNSARNIANNTKTISSLIGNQQGSGAIKLTADLQNFLGVKTPTANVNQVIEAIATKGATEIRTPGSGSTSDLEFGAYKSAFPSLATSKEGRDIMVKIAEANAIRNAKLSDWARKQYQAGTFSYEGLAAEDNRLGRAVSPEIEARVKQLTATSPGANNPNQGLLNQADKILENIPK